MSLSSIISVYWAAWYSSEFVIPQRRYDLCLLLLPVRILNNIPERSLNTRSFAPFLMWTRGKYKQVKTGYSTFFHFISPSSLWFVYFHCWNRHICNGTSMCDRLIERVFLCSVFSETLDESWIWTFAENLLSKSFANFAQ